MTKLLFLLGLGLGSMLAQPQLTANQANEKFDEMVAQIGAGRFDKAGLALSRIQAAIRAETEQKFSPTVFERARQIQDGVGLMSTLALLRSQYETKNWVAASESATMLGFGLASLWMKTDPNKRFEILAEDFNNTRDLQKDFTRSAILTTAVEAKRWDDAEVYAREVLRAADKNEIVMDAGRYRHLAYTVAGLAAMAKGKQKEAAEALLASAKVQTEQILRTLGPNTRLAEALLAAGDKATVLAYLDLLGNWNWRDSGRLAEWKQQITAGKTPDFSRYNYLH